MDALPNQGLLAATRLRDAQLADKYGCGATPDTYARLDADAAGAAGLGAGAGAGDAYIFSSDDSGKNIQKKN